MILALLQFELTIPHSQSLKDKRRVVKSLKDRLHREHLVSIAEVGDLDHLRHALLAVGLVSNSAPHASSVLDSIVEKLKGVHEARLGAVSRVVIRESELDWSEDDEAGDDPAWTAAEESMARDAERLLGNEPS